MMQAISPFVFDNSFARALDRRGEPWFVSSELARVYQFKTETHETVDATSGEVHCARPHRDPGETAETVAGASAK